MELDPKERLAAAIAEIVGEAFDRHLIRSTTTVSFRSGGKDFSLNVIFRPSGKHTISINGYNPLNRRSVIANFSLDSSNPDFRRLARSLRPYALNWAGDCPTEMGEETAGRIVGLVHEFFGKDLVHWGDGNRGYSRSRGQQYMAFYRKEKLEKSSGSYIFPDLLVKVNLATGKVHIMMERGDSSLPRTITSFNLGDDFSSEALRRRVAKAAMEFKLKKGS